MVTPILPTPACRHHLQQRRQVHQTFPDGAGVPRRNLQIIVFHLVQRNPYPRRDAASHCIVRGIELTLPLRLQTPLHAPARHTTVD